MKYPGGFPLQLGPPASTAPFAKAKPDAANDDARNPHLSISPPGGSRPPSLEFELLWKHTASTAQLETSQLLLRAAARPASTPPTSALRTTTAPRTETAADRPPP